MVAPVGNEAQDIAAEAALASPLASIGLSDASASTFVAGGVSDGDVSMVRQLAPAVLADVGTAQRVYGAKTALTSTIAQRIEGGGRILEVMRGPSSPTAFTYDVQIPAGAQIVADPNGGELMIGTRTEDADGNVTMDVTHSIGAAWAVDRNGEQLPAGYALDGSKLTMTVDTTGAAFPVTADPTWTKNGFRATWSKWTPYKATVYLNKARTDDAMDGHMVSCAVFALLPGVGVFLGIACAFMAYLVKTTTHLVGQCARFDVTAVNPKHPKISFYKGGFCT